MQTNPLHFLNYQLYFKTPILATVAIFCWLVPIATLYPPGTLIVGIQPSSIEKSFNVSVFHHRSLQDILEDNVIARISCYDRCPDGSCAVRKPPLPELTKKMSFLETCIVEKSVSFSQFLSKFHQDSSYHLLIFL